VHVRERGRAHGFAGHARIAAAQLAAADSAQIARVAREAVGATPLTDVHKVAAALLAAIRQKVRYTGIELGNGSIVPRSPSETLQRRYGDCKDQALLLQALLGSLGIKAQVALLHASMGYDIEPALPALTGFNHAIVYVPAQPPLWIDPTNEFARAGELPLWDQGRSALIADVATRALVQTPVAPLGANRSLEVRDVFLAERGPARIVESRELSGSFERAARHEQASSDAKTREERLARYAHSEFLAEKITSHDEGDARALDAPWRTRLEMSEARRGFSDDATAAVALRRESLLSSLPQPLLGEEEAKPARTVDFIVPEPYVFEQVYRIHPPPGFAPKPLPKGETSDVGPFKLTSQYTIEPSGLIVARLSFTTAKSRLTPAEMAAVRSAYREIKEGPAILIELEQVARAQLDAGHVVAALAELRKLVALHPQESLHHVQLAQALLSAGLRDPALQEIDRALALDPANGHAFYMRGWILEHDGLGRRFARGFDLAGAEAAFRRAIALDNKDAVARADLAILLEHDSDGVRYGARARMSDAVAEYRALVKATGNHRLDENVLFVLFFQRRFAELVEAARALPRGSARDQLLLAGVAATAGVPAALAEAQRLQDEHSPGTLQAAGLLLVKVRLYERAVALLTEALRSVDGGASTIPQLEMWQHMRHHEDIPMPDSDPTTVVRKLILDLFAEHADAAQLRSYVVREARADLDDHAVTNGLVSVRAQLGGMLRGLGLPYVVMRDMIASLLELKAEGDDRLGYRVHMSAPPAFGMPAQNWYVVREEGQYRVLGAGEDDVALARRALHALEAGDTAVARRSLEWTGQRIADDLRLSAALLVVNGTAKDAALGLPILRAAQKTAHDPELLDKISIAMASAAMHSGQPAEALPLVEAVLARHIGDPVLTRIKLDVLQRLGRWDEVRALAEAMLKASPSDVDALHILERAAEVQQRWDDFERAVRSLVQLGKATAVDYNERAWDALFHGPLGEAALADAQHAVEMSQHTNVGELHTLATLLGELGRAEEARKVLLELLDRRGGEPSPLDYLIIGRISDLCGVPEAAAAAYQKIPKPSGAEIVALSSWTVAQRHLSSLSAAH
jgi:tetratricopeptide (TPR) repeat protein